MEKLQLREQQILPAEEVISKVLGDSYTTFAELNKIITSSEYNLLPEWNYYKDGNAWLCKVCFKNKTVFWLSVWDGYFKVAFYFTEKTMYGIADLDIDIKIKEDFVNNKPIGRLLPLVIDVYRTDQINDVLLVINFKKSLK
jgi:hypothetical protein